MRKVNAVSKPTTVDAPETDGMNAPLSKVNKQNLNKTSHLPHHITTTVTLPHHRGHATYHSSSSLCFSMVE